jgi:hypothetical protein
MKGWMREIRRGLLILIFLSACTAGELTQAASPTEGGISPVVTNTPFTSSTPSRTITDAAPTTLRTVIPINTPTEGPPPDLELLNLTLEYRGNGFGFLFGEIRNNTDIAMVFPGGQSQRIPILRFQMEAWEWDGNMGFYWYHEFSVGRGFGDAWYTNCFLYPGETGLIRIYTPGCQNYPDNCISETTFIDEPPKATGMQLVGYQDLKTYIPWPNLSSGYHLQVENPTYDVEEDRLRFGFDLPKSFFNRYYDYITWVVVYDEKGEMLGFLSRYNIEDITMDSGGDTYRINGYYRTAGDTGERGENYFRGDLLDVDFARIDHIRVMVEKQHDFLCFSNRYDDYRKYMTEHPEESGA